MMYNMWMLERSGDPGQLYFFTAVVAAILFCLHGCGTGGTVQEESSEPGRAGSMTSKSEMVALVDGVPIFMKEARFMMDGGESTAGEAVDALIDHELLAAEAIRRGWGKADDVEYERTKAQAAALLRCVGEETTVEDVDLDEIKKRYSEQKKRFVHDPLRKVIHAVVLTGKKGMASDDARSAAREIAVATAGVMDGAGFETEVKALKKKNGWKVKVESLPPFEKDDDRFVAAFVDAAYDISGPGEISPAFETEFGWHVIMMLEDLPASDISFEEARGILAEEILPGVRQRRAAELVDRLVKEAGVFIHDRNLGAGAP
jgi:peptidyl-prolyl cis-trans isomerase C